jgi:hypothetical protein
MDSEGTPEKIRLPTYMWDSAKEPHGFFQFMMDFTALVRMFAGGLILETFLDPKLDRSQAAEKMKPQWLQGDPHFQDSDDEPEPPGQRAPPAPRGSPTSASDSQRTTSEAQGDPLPPGIPEQPPSTSTGSTSITVAQIGNLLHTVEAEFQRKNQDAYHAPHIRKLDRRLFSTLPACRPNMGQQRF